MDGPPGGALGGWPGADGSGLAGGDRLPVGCGRLPAGWTWAFGTPYNMARQHAHGGTAASPLIISWLPGMADMAGGVRDQYHHAADIVPTISGALWDVTGRSWTAFVPLCACALSLTVLGVFAVRHRPRSQTLAL